MRVKKVENLIPLKSKMDMCEHFFQYWFQIRKFPLVSPLYFIHITYEMNNTLISFVGSNKKYISIGFPLGYIHIQFSKLWCSYTLSIWYNNNWVNYSFNLLETHLFHLTQQTNYLVHFYQLNELQKK